jgi:hypothetical protein
MSDSLSMRAMIRRWWKLEMTNVTPSPVSAS